MGLNINKNFQLFTRENKILDDLWKNICHINGNNVTEVKNVYYILTELSKMISYFEFEYDNEKIKSKYRDLIRGMYRYHPIYLIKSCRETHDMLNDFIVAGIEWTQYDGTSLNNDCSLESIETDKYIVVSFGSEHNYYVGICKK